MQALATKVAEAEKSEPEGQEDSSEAEEPESAEDDDSETDGIPIATATPTLGPPMVSVSANTNCRAGPGDIYDYLGALLVGEEALVTGKLADESYWYIENPDAPPPQCWLWGMYATVSGDKSGIPVLTAPPTPTPENTPTPTPEPMSFVATFSKFRDECGSFIIFVRIKNTGGIDLESYSISLHIPQTGQSLYSNRNYFADAPVCGYAELEHISPGTHEYIAMTGMTFMNGTRTLEMTIQVCSENGQGGTCKETYIEETLNINF
jgi:hypothetical protein